MPTLRHLVVMLGFKPRCFGLHCPHSIPLCSPIRAMFEVPPISNLMCQPQTAAKALLVSITQLKANFGPHRSQSAPTAGKSAGSKGPSNVGPSGIDFNLSSSLPRLSGVFKNISHVFLVIRARVSAGCRLQHPVCKWVSFHGS